MGLGASVTASWGAWELLVGCVTLKKVLPSLALQFTCLKRWEGPSDL